jgi:hypothetical protein
MYLRISVSALGQFFDASVTIEVTEPYVRAFKPLRTTDDPMTAYANGELTADSASARVVMKFREEAAKEIAAALTDQLVKIMQRNDTFNGYVQN